MGADTLEGDRVVNTRGEDLGKITDIMLDVQRGRIAYAVLSVGGFLGIGDKLFAVPWGAVALDIERKCFVLDIEKDRLDGRYDVGHAGARVLQCTSLLGGVLTLR